MTADILLFKRLPPNELADTGLSTEGPGPNGEWEGLPPPATEKELTLMQRARLGMTDDDYTRLRAIKDE